MIDETVADRYSQALMNLALEKGSPEKYLEDLNLSKKLLEDLPGVGKSIVEINAPPNIMKKIIKLLLVEKVNRDVLSFLMLLVDNNRGEYLSAIIRHFSRKLDIMKNIINAELIFAVSPSEGLVGEIKEKLYQSTGKNVNIQVRNDPKLIGGFAIVIGDKILDYSILGQLELMRKKLRRASII